MQSLLQKPPFECQGVEKIPLYQFVSQPPDFQHSNNLPKLSEIKLGILLVVADKPNIQAKEVGEQIHLDRIKTLNYLKELVKDSFLTSTQLPAQNEAMKGAYCFTLAPEISKSDILAVMNAQKTEDIDYFNKQQLQGFLRKQLDETGKTALLDLCEHPQSTAQQIIKRTGLILKQKSLQDKLSSYSRKLELLYCEKLPTADNTKINHYSIAKNLPRNLIKAILLSENNTNLEKQSINSATCESEGSSFEAVPKKIVRHKTVQVLSADDFLRLQTKLENSRDRVANLEKEICEGGELTTDKISPLWSKFSLKDSLSKQSTQIISADDFLRKVKELQHYRNQVANLEKEICQGGELTTNAISPLWSKISFSQNNQSTATEK